MDKLSNMLFFRLFQTANILHKAGSRSLEHKQVTTQQWSILGALSRPQAKDGMTAAELSDYLMVSRQNISGILARMEQRGLVERVVDAKDQRARRIHLTTAGAGLWDDIAPLISDFYEQALAELSYDDRVGFVHYMNKLQAALKPLSTRQQGKVS